MKKVKLTSEELKARGIMDDAAIFEGPAWELFDMSLSRFATKAERLKSEIARAAAGYGFTEEGGIALLFWGFYQMGAWDGCHAYRKELIENEIEKREEAGEKLCGIPATRKFEFDEGALAGLVSALDDPINQKTLHKIVSDYPIFYWCEEEEDEGPASPMSDRDEDVIAREVLFGLTDGIVEG